MNNFEIILLAFALVFNSWIAYINAGIVLSGEALVRKVNYAGMMFLIQFIMLGAGIWIGYKTGSLEIRQKMLICLSMMFIFGIKDLLT